MQRQMLKLLHKGDRPVKVLEGPRHLGDGAETEIKRALSRAV